MLGVLGCWDDVRILGYVGMLGWCWDVRILGYVEMLGWCWDTGMMAWCWDVGIGIVSLLKIRWTFYPWHIQECFWDTRSTVQWFCLDVSKLQQSLLGQTSSLALKTPNNFICFSLDTDRSLSMNGCAFLSLIWVSPWRKAFGIHLCLYLNLFDCCVWWRLSLLSVDFLFPLGKWKDSRSFC
jgi:hypothetical protein